MQNTIMELLQLQWRWVSWSLAMFALPLYSPLLSLSEFEENSLKFWDTVYFSTF